MKIALTSPSVRVFSLFILLLFLGCESVQEKARREVDEELAAREAAWARSMKFYETGVAAIEDDDVARARELFTEAVSASRRNAFAWVRLGIVEHQLENLSAAAHAFKKAARFAPNHYQPHFNLGSTLEMAGRYDDAIVAYKRALELAPNQVEVLENLARCYLRNRSNSEVLDKLVERALTLEHRPEWRRWLEAQRDRDRNAWREVTPVNN